MHAKMTRDRKKNFIANMEKTISRYGAPTCVEKSAGQRFPYAYQ
jgi:hypothetical protein